MNKKNIQIAIDVMKRAGEVDMLLYQRTPGQFDKTVYSEEEAHECGTIACFAGWLSLSPEFKEQGGKISSTGYPDLNGRYGPSAIGDFLGVDRNTAIALCGAGLGSPHSEYYGKKITHITAQDVIEKLTELLTS